MFNKTCLRLFFSVFLICVCSNLAASSMQEHEVIELQQRLLLAGFPTGDKLGVLGDATIVAAQNYANDPTLKRDQLPIILHRLRSAKETIAWVSQSEFTHLQNTLKQTQRELHDLKIAFDGSTEKFNLAIKNQLYQYLVMSAIGIFAFFLGGGGVLFIIAKRLGTKFETNLSNISKDFHSNIDSIINKKVKKTNNDIDEKVKIVEQNINEMSTSLVSKLAGRISYLMFAIIDKQQLGEEYEKIFIKVILDLSEKSINDVLSLESDEHEKQKIQQIMNIVYYMSKYYSKEKLLENKKDILSYIKVAEPSINKEYDRLFNNHATKSSDKKIIERWIDKKQCLIFCLYKLEEITENDVKKNMDFFRQHVDPEVINEYVRDFPTIYPTIDSDED